jgi:multidrug resistance efflux pump
MPVKRRYNIKGTRDFIVLAGIFFFLCLWSIKDAWYPAPKVLEKHPRIVAVSFTTSGSIGEMHVAKGDSVGEKQLLAELRQVKMQEDFETAKLEYAAAKNKHILMAVASRNAVKNGASDDGIAEREQSLANAQAAMDAALEKVTTARARIDSTELRAPTKGVVKEVLAGTYGQVEAGETVMLIDPKDHFYLFNKSLAIFSFIAFWVFLGIHIFAH